MSPRLARNLIACLIVVAILSLMLVSGGCSTHQYKIVGLEGREVIIESRLEFEQIETEYRRNDEEVIFRFRAGTATATPWLDDETLEAIKILSERQP
jgi:hypothetical protein